jgi:hypothetical protein
MKDDKLYLSHILESINTRSSYPYNMSSPYRRWLSCRLEIARQYLTCWINNSYPYRVQLLIAESY